jgi:hypothetical protein
LANLDKLKRYSWPEENFEIYKDILNKYLDELNEKIETEKKSAEFKKALKNLMKLKNDVSNLDLKGIRSF